MATPPLTRRGFLGRVSASALSGLVGAGTLSCSGRVDAAQAAVDVTSFGASPSLRDNSGALRAAIAALPPGGGTVAIPDGTFRFASASIGRGGIVLPPGITLRGAGRERTHLVVSGGSVCNFLVATNSAGVTIADLTIVGNSVGMVGATIYGNGAAVRLLQTQDARSDVAHLTLQRLHVENFAGPYWIEIASTAAERTMHDILVEDVSFRSLPGNSPGPRDIAMNSAALCVAGHAGTVANVRLRGIRGDARYIKTGIILYHGVEDAEIAGVVIENAGQAGAADDAGAYAVQVYDSQSRMKGIRILDPVLRAPRSVGIYVAGGRNVTIRNPDISGQTDQHDETLPKAAIAFNGTRGWRVTGGRLTGNWRDMEIVSPHTAAGGDVVDMDAVVEDLVATGSRAGAVVRHARGQVARNLRFARCRFQVHGRAILVDNAAGSGGHIDDVVFDSCQIEADAGFRAIDLWGTSGSAAGGYQIRDCTLVGTNPLLARDIEGSLLVEGCDIRDRGTIPDTAAATLAQCPKLTVRDCVLDAPGPGGIGIDLEGSQGIVSNLRFTRAAYRLPRTSRLPQLGRERPRFAGKAGDFVQNLAAADTSAGWTWQGGWKGMP